MFLPKTPQTIASGFPCLGPQDPGSITSAKLADSNLAARHIADTAVQTLQLDDGSITTAKIADGTISSANMGVVSALFVQGVFGVDATTDSTDKDTGALVVLNGGMGVQLDTNVGGSLDAGSLDVQGNYSSPGTITLVPGTALNGISGVASGSSMATKNGKHTCAVSCICGGLR